MELMIPAAEELRAAYERDLKEAFPSMELKPLSHIVQMRKRGRYQPWCLYDEQGKIIGECFLWMGAGNRALLDYLCVTAEKRNGGIGTRMIEKMLAMEPGRVVLVESEAPADAPDAALAERRLEFYRRNGARMAGYDTELFGVHYRTLYWADRDLTDETVLRAHRDIYEISLIPEKYARYIRIPRTAEEGKRENSGV